jgi:hypothetical protein
MKILQPETRKLVRGIIMYNVPGALTEAEKAEVRARKAEWLRTQR